MEQNDSEPTEPDPSVPVAGTSPFAQPPSRPRPGKKLVTFAVAPLVILTAIGYIGTAFRPQLIKDHPLVLLMTDPRTLNMTLVSAKIATVSFFTVVIIRRLLADPCYYLLGKWYGDSAIRWLERRSPDIGALATTIERWFPRWGRLLIFLYPHPLVMMLAGESAMTFAEFMAWDFLGTLGLTIAVREFGWFAGSAVNPVTHFISKYSIPLTVLSVLLTVYYVWDARRNGKSKFESFSGIEQELESESNRPAQNPPDH